MRGALGAGVYPPHHVHHAHDHPQSLAEHKPRQLGSPGLATHGCTRHVGIPGVRVHTHLQPGPRSSVPDGRPASSVSCGQPNTGSGLCQSVGNGTPGERAAWTCTPGAPGVGGPTPLAQDRVRRPLQDQGGHAWEWVYEPAASGPVLLTWASTGHFPLPGSCRVPGHLDHGGQLPLGCIPAASPQQEVEDGALLIPWPGVPTAVPPARWGHWSGCYGAATGTGMRPQGVEEPVPDHEPDPWQMSAPSAR